MKYLLIIGDGMADEPVASLGGKTPLQTAKKPTIDRLAAQGIIGAAVNCPPPLPAGSETAILSIFGCDPLRYFTGRSPMEAAALGVALREGDVCYRCNLIAMDEGDMPYEEKRILSHSAGSIAGEDALAVCSALKSDPAFSAALREANMELFPSPTFRPLVVQHGVGKCGVKFIPPHDHLGEKCGGLLPSDDAQAEVFVNLQRLAHAALENHPVTKARRAAGKMGANGVWFWAAGSAMLLPSFVDDYHCTGAVVAAVPICQGIGVLRGLEMIEVEGATGEIDTNFEGKLEASWDVLQKHDFLCLHLEAPDECTHNGDLPGKLQAIEWLDSRLVAPLLSRLDEKGEDYRVLILSDHKTLTATRGHAGGTVPFLIYDSRIDTKCGAAYDEAHGDASPHTVNGARLLDILFEKSALGQ
ncbi:MAG: 2,3-bisphosphoglycerate-independent phosphoglycerate mutase [Oscillospiraceae bacterium]|nr:2,3-bisphosphoglycerate-independent phosphoglycerate mutase [Oscillospiraceae bacterium]